MKRQPDKRAAVDAVAETGADADAEYLARAMADVVPLPADPRGRVRAAPAIGAPRGRALSVPAPEEHGHDGQIEAGFVAPGVDRRELRRLKRGEHLPGRRLDLHGKTAAESVQSVKRFLESSRHRCVCIVHGRGLHSEGNVSILKTHVRAYLRQHRGVLAYADAPRSDGGAGAVYVLLRK